MENHMMHIKLERFDKKGYKFLIRELIETMKEKVNKALIEMEFNPTNTQFALVDYKFHKTKILLHYKVLPKGEIERTEYRREN